MSFLLIKTYRNRLFVFIFLLFSVFSLSAQKVKNIKNYQEYNWFASVDYGIQMSGIKNEDFVSSNYSPLLRLSMGKWFAKKIGVKIGYQGTYFYTITDDNKNHYNFYYGEILIDIKKIILKRGVEEFYKPVFHIGPGYFYNHTYKRGDIHGIIGLSNYFSISNRVSINLEPSAIIGWDIYQGDNDILPSFSLGLSYSF